MHKTEHSSLLNLFCYCTVDPTVISLDRRPQQPDCLLEGSNVVLTCNIDGFPLPDVTFLKDNVTVPRPEDIPRITKINDQVPTPV